MINCNTKKSCKKKCNEEYLFFTQFLCEEKIVVPDKKLDIEDIISVIVDPEIISLRIIDTPIGCSVEGQNLTGKKLSVEIKMRQKIVYVAQAKSQSVHVVENECYKSVVIVMPKLINGAQIERLLSHKYIKVDLEVENAKATKIDERNIYKSVLLFIKAQVIPSYLLCYTEDHNCNKSELFIAFKDGTRKKEIACFNEGKILNPQWSPCGLRIAYICKNEKSSFLCVADIRGTNTYRVTDIDYFKYVSNFSWCADGNTILFTSLFNNKEIFIINLNTLEWKQLTYGGYNYSSIKPKPSYDGEYIGYIKISRDNQNLYLMKKNGLGNKKLTNLNSVKDFCWENDNLRMAVVCNEINESNNKEDYSLGCENSGDEIFLIDIKCNDAICLNVAKFKLNIKKIKISSDNRYISFIGEDLGIEDIYLFDLLKNEIINLTENQYGINIGDYDWNIDSLDIYYSCNELNYYNVYFISICDKTKTQISNTKANNIKLSYRPRIL